MKFVDTAEISLRAGDGGSGVISFRREKFVPKGGPDGGTGGRGGDIIIRANQHLTTLLDFQYRRHYRAHDGAHGSGARKTGKSGQPTVLLVPVGTIVRDVETGEQLGDLTADGQEIIAAEGGRGGRGNAEFATSTDQAPRRYEPGEDGEERRIELELKLLADVGLVGLPNAGKSTLISVISAARPKIADYPFTTLVPNLGIVRVDDGRSFVVADIPGLIQGAHLGKGLGIQFLRHIERTKVLVFLLDVTHGDVHTDFEVLVHELREFNSHLPERPTLIALTKIDIVPDNRMRALNRLRFGDIAVHPISAVTGRGIPPLIQDMWKLIGKEQARALPKKKRRSSRLMATVKTPAASTRRARKSSG
jgi:GTP-binding protein